MKWQVIFSILLLAIAILLALLFVEIAQKTPIVSTLNNTIFFGEEKALLTFALNGWAENQYNVSEIIIALTLNNYGYKEARNMVVTCEIYDGDEDGNFKSQTPLSFATNNVGNIASTSYKSTQVYLANNDFINDYSLASCFIQSCEDCEILDNRLKA